MHKKDLINAVKSKTSMTKKEISLIIDVIFDEMTFSLDAGEKVVIANFGTFEKQERSGYMGYHPITGETIEISEHAKISFKSAKYLKDKINDKS
jgi:DNA-binding protein HU-beta